MSNPQVALPNAPAEAPERPQLILFYAPTSGPCRRVEGFLSQVLQRRHNHDTFRLVRVNADDHPDLVEHFRVVEVPTVFVVERRRVRAKLEAPKGRRELEDALKPWLI